MRTLNAIIASLAILACGSSTSPTSPADSGCTQGETQKCFGPGVCDGVQICNRDHNWGTCVCGSDSSGGASGESSSDEPGGSENSAGNGGENAATGSGGKGQGGSGGTPRGIGGKEDAGVGGAGEGGATTDGIGGRDGGMSGNVAGNSTGGATGIGGGPTGCTDVVPCGGNVVGTWNVSSSCLELTGDMDVSITSLGCRTVPVTGYLQTSGTFIANPDNTYTDNTTTTGAASFPLSADCLTVSSVPVPCTKIGAIFQAVGWSTAVCTDTAGQCNCSLTVNHQAAPGAVVSYTEPSGAYSTSGNSFTAENVTYSYCEAGDSLSLTPDMSGLRGTIVLQREGTTGHD